jgi:N-methylhydantoinase B/oxoprolinase/acetone carboxylase alpha subunit
MHADTCDLCGSAAAAELAAAGEQRCRTVLCRGCGLSSLSPRAASCASRRPGAAGVGDPRERSPALVFRDVQQGKVSIVAARDVYSVVIRPDGTLDDAETAQMRQQSVGA